MAQTNANLIWTIADLLRGPYQPNQHGDVILLFPILRRLDCILEPNKDEVLARYKVKSMSMFDVAHVGRRLTVRHPFGAYRLSTSVLPDRLCTVVWPGAAG